MFDDRVGLPKSTPILIAPLQSNKAPSLQIPANPSQTALILISGYPKDPTITNYSFTTSIPPPILFLPPPPPPNTPTTSTFFIVALQHLHSFTHSHHQPLNYCHSFQCSPVAPLTIAPNLVPPPRSPSSSFNSSNIHKYSSAADSSIVSTPSSIHRYQRRDPSARFLEESQ